MILLILPNQLFEKEYFPKEIEEIYIYEHPQYFTKYKFNKKKLVLHRASMKYYFDYLKKKNFKVKYFNFDDKLENEDYIMFDPIDKIKTKNNINIIESPNFLLTKEQYAKYRKKTDKFLFTNFYMWSKNELDLFPKLKSLDSMNRETFKDNIDIPDLPNNGGDSIQEYIDSAINYVNKYFPNNYGNTDDFIYPIDHKTARKWLNDFLKKKLNLFGPYQDFVKEGENYMFHSVLSSSINIGLINPMEIVDELKKYKSKVKINSFEGYLRQLFWREYQRYTYIYINYKTNNKLNYNYFGNSKKLNKKWYNGELGIKPIDDLIKDAFDTGYLHHIGRLMFIGNFMNLYGLHPLEGFKWFMEFSIDSYDWVMCQNVLDMVFFCTGGMTMRRPYSSSSNYILKMSSYSKDEWVEIWDKYYNNFMKKHKKKLWKFRYHFPMLKNI